MWGAWLEDKGCLMEPEGRNVAQPEELRPGKLVSNPGTNAASHFCCLLNICFSFSLTADQISLVLQPHCNMAGPNLPINASSSQPHPNY